MDDQSPKVIEAFGLHSSFLIRVSSFFLSQNTKARGAHRTTGFKCSIKGPGLPAAAAFVAVAAATATVAAVKALAA
ncbi:MAG TPA: hypothetical protein VGE39_07675, partial [Prosthecobacter sp.]